MAPSGAAEAGRRGDGEKGAIISCLEGVATSLRCRSDSWWARLGEEIAGEAVVWRVGG